MMDGDGVRQPSFGEEGGELPRVVGGRERAEADIPTVRRCAGDCKAEKGSAQDAFERFHFRFL